MEATGTCVPAHIPSCVKWPRDAPEKVDNPLRVVPGCVWKPALTSPVDLIGSAELQGLPCEWAGRCCSQAQGSPGQGALSGPSSAGSVPRPLWWLVGSPALVPVRGDQRRGCREDRSGAGERCSGSQWGFLFLFIFSLEHS